MPSIPHNVLNPSRWDGTKGLEHTTLTKRASLRVLSSEVSEGPDHLDLSWLRNLARWSDSSDATTDPDAPVGRGGAGSNASEDATSPLLLGVDRRNPTRLAGPA